ncbi:type II secretion system F family protein [Cellulosimicrobium marinum]|uniref:type II secretion system F family protein n=1 Tax=Cellulosimicrobium marinum TaxID=1638992 RepID=UPI001E296A32|nr:type II secretion system F family protein [Cellulosimicrobium marinum]MCB7135252.1 type II secretion system F family protein [Cellulosimicrobium marinum]
MTGTLVACCALVALGPWWSARARAGRRVASLGRTTSSPRRGEDPAPGVESGVLLELLAAAVRAGASVPRALDAVGAAVGGPDGAGLRRAASALLLGAAWDTAWTGTPARLDVVRRALRPAWVHGAGPVASLRAAGEALRQDRAAAARTAAARLGVHLVLPLGACFLPAFVLVGLVPVLLSLGAGLLGG